MCIAIYKPSGISVPSNETLKLCFENNPDGAGYMYAFNNKVYIEKGLMTFKKFKSSLKKTIKKVGDITNIPFVFHFRISTQGGVQKGLCHPFPVCGSYDTMKKLSQTCDMAIAHNGVIDFASSYSVKNHNDTMEFTKNVVNNIIGNTNFNFYESKSITNCISYLLGTNRVVILDKLGHATTFGDWVEDNGVFYSNTSYKEVKTKISNWKTYYDYDDYGYGYGFDKYSEVSLSKIQEKEFNDTYFITCDCCGGDTYLYYDNDLQKVVAYCIDCGTTFILPDDLAEKAKAMGLVYFDNENSFANAN